MTVILKWKYERRGVKFFNGKQLWGISRFEAGVFCNYQLCFELPKKSNCGQAAWLNLSLSVGQGFGLQSLPFAFLIKVPYLVRAIRLTQLAKWRLAAQQSWETYQQKNFAVWLYFMLLHVLDEAAICIPVNGKHMLGQQHRESEGSSQTSGSRNQEPGTRRVTDNQHILCIWQVLFSFFSLPSPPPPLVGGQLYF